MATRQSRFEAHPSAQLKIGRRLYLGCFRPVIGDIVDRDKDRAIVRLYERASFVTDGTVQLGPGVRVTVGANAELFIGDGSYVVCNSLIVCSTKIHIGRDCAISWGVQILDTSFHSLDRDDDVRAPVHIGDHVWIASNVSILKGVTVGDGAVIGTGSVVTRDVPAHTFVAGVPARVIRSDVRWAI